MKKSESLDDIRGFITIFMAELNIITFIKMKYQHKQIEEILICRCAGYREQREDCYAVLGIVHTMWKPIPGRFKTISPCRNQLNMYQSLHTTVIGDNGEPFEIQIRHMRCKVANMAIAAHWKYKEGDTSGKASNDDIKLTVWLRQSLEWQKDLNDPKDFLETMKMIYLQVRYSSSLERGDVIELPGQDRHRRTSRLRFTRPSDVNV